MCGRSELLTWAEACCNENEYKLENADWIILLFQMDMKSVGTFYYESFVSVILFMVQAFAHDTEWKWISIWH